MENERRMNFEELFLMLMEKYSDDFVLIYAAMRHMERLSLVFSEVEKDSSFSSRSEVKYWFRIVERFIQTVDSLHQTLTIPPDFVKDHFLLGEMCMNNYVTAQLSQVLRSRAFYLHAFVGAVLDLKVERITDSNYELLILHKHSLNFKLDDLYMTVILPKTGTTILLAKGDYIRAAIIDYDRKTLQLIVSLDQTVVKDLDNIKLGKLKTKNTACNIVSTNHKYQSHYLKTSPMLFNKSKWEKEMEALGISPFINQMVTKQPNRPNQLPPSKTVCDALKEIQVNPSDERAKKHLAKVFLKAARSYDEKEDISKAIRCLKAAKQIWSDRHSFSHSITKKFSKKLMKAWSKV